jgi:hypothetical protein
MVHAARASVNRAVARFILRSGSAASKGSSAAPPSTRHFLIAGEKILKTELTPSVPSPNEFLIATLCPTFFSFAPLPALLIGTPIRLEFDLTRSQQTRKDFLIGTIRPTFFFRAAPHPSPVTDPSSPRRVISIRYKWNSQNRRSDENKGETAFYSLQIYASRRRRCAPRITNHYSPITNHELFDNFRRQRWTYAA